MWGGSSRTPAQLAELVAQDLSRRSSRSRRSSTSSSTCAPEYGSGYQPFVVMLRGDDAHAVEPAERDPAQSRHATRGRLMGRAETGRAADRRMADAADRRMRSGERAARRPDGRRGGSSASSPSSPSARSGPASWRCLQSCRR